MLNFTEYRNKLFEAEEVVKAQPTNKFGEWNVILNKLSKYKEKATSIKSPTSSNVDQQNNNGGVVLQVNTNFIIECTTGYKYDMTYARSTTDTVPLYYIVSSTDDGIITNAAAGITFIDDNEFGNIKKLFKILKIWRNKLSDTNKLSTTPATNISTTGPDTYNYTVTNANTKSPATDSQLSITTSKFDSTILSAICNVQFIKKEKEFTDVKNIIKTLPDNIKGMTYSQFITLEQSFQPLSRKFELSTKWFIKVRIRGNDNKFSILKLTQYINKGDILNLCKYKENKKVSIGEVANIQLKNK